MSEQNPYLLYPEHLMDRRPRYYDGQFLKADDFNDVQRYAIDRRRRHLQATVRPGIVAGLEPTAAADEVTLSAGAAVDDIGRQIVLVEAQSKAIAAEDRGQVLTLYIVWSETASDEAEGDEGTAGFTRFHELPDVGYVARGAALPAHAIMLATVNVDGDGNIELDTTTRPRAGLRVPGPTPLTLTSDEADPGRATLAAALRVTVPDGTAHAPEAPALDVAGHARVTGGLVVGQESATGYHVTHEADALVVAGQLAAGGAAGSAIYKLAIGSAPPAQGEGTLVAQRIGVGRTTVTAGHALDITGKARVDGAADITGALTVSAPLRVQGAGATIDGATTIGGALGVTGPLDADGLRVDGATTLVGAVDLDGALAVQGTLAVESGTLDLGVAAAGRQSDAGKLVYGADALTLYGAGATAAARRVAIRAEGQLTVTGPTDIDGALTAGALTTDAAITAGTTLTAQGKATLRSGVEVVGSAVITRQLAVGQTTFEGYGNVTADANDLVVNGQFAAGGSGGSALYSLAVGADAQGGKEGYLFVSDRIGINTLNPQRRLDVAGTARITGDTELGAGLTVSGAASIGTGLDVGGDSSVDGMLTVADKLTVGDGIDPDGGLYFPRDLWKNGQWAGLRYWRPADTGHVTRLELGTGRDADDVLVLKQYDTDVVTLYDAKVGIHNATPAYRLDVSGDMHATGRHVIDGHIDLGMKHAGRNGNAGKIAYDTFRSGQYELELVGGGASGSDRKIHMWAEGGLTIEGKSIELDTGFAVVSKGSPARVLWGSFNSDGSTIASRGLTASWNSSGKYYYIDYGTNFVSYPAVIGQVVTAGNVLKDNLQVYDIYKGNCKVMTGDDDFDRVQRAFCVMIIGDCT
ncbi:MAG: hypothetical protein R3F65_17985 [bacterium]